MLSIKSRRFAYTAREKARRESGTVRRSLVSGLCRNLIGARDCNEDAIGLSTVDLTVAPPLS